MSESAERKLTAENDFELSKNSLAREFFDCGYDNCSDSQKVLIDSRFEQVKAARLASCERMEPRPASLSEPAATFSISEASCIVHDIIEQHQSNLLGGECAAVLLRAIGLKRAASVSPVGPEPAKEKA